MKHFLLFAALTFFIAASSYAQVRINEVSVDVDFGGQVEWVELYNEGSAAVDVSSWWLCNFPDYRQISNVTAITVLSGNTTIQPGEYLVVSYAGIFDQQAEVGLYTTNASNFSDGMSDYMQYGTSGHTRESVAVTAGVWTAGNTVEKAPAGKTYSWFGGGTMEVDDWAAGDATPGAMNAVATAIENQGSTPESFTLLGNYPNPFNPSTSVVFDLPFAADVSLEVVDIIGRVVATVPTRFMQSGNNLSLLVDGANLNSGMYIYRVTAANTESEIVRTGVMTLLK